jgi:hypothetical protein
MRDGEDKLIRRSYWLDMDDPALVLAMTQGIGVNLTNDEKRAHLTICDGSTSSTKFAFRRCCQLRSRTASL